MKSKANASYIKSFDGAKIYYWVTCKSWMNKQPVVIHAGASNNHTAVEKIAYGFNERKHPTLIFDQWGIGYSAASPKKKPHTLKDYSSDLEAMINKAGFEKPDIVGHSFGFPIAVYYVAKTGNASTLTGICTSYNFSKTINPFLLQVGNAVGLLEYPLQIIQSAKHKLKGEERKYVNLDLEGQNLQFMNFILRNTDIPWKEVRVHRIGSDLMSWDISKQLGIISNPIHLIQGNNDSLINHKAGEEIKRLAKGKVALDIIKGNHLLAMTYPNRVLEAIDRYESIN